MTIQSDAFAPNAQTAMRLDQSMHAGLAMSLKHICDELAKGAGWPCYPLRAVVTDLNNGMRVGPITFAHYYELSEKLFAQDLPGANVVMDQLVSNATPANPQSFCGLDPQTRPQHRRYFDLLIEGAEGRMGITPPDAPTTRAFQRRLSDGLELARQYLPSLLDEFNALVREVICIAPDPSKTNQIDGGSHYQLWGALFLNAAFHPTDVSIVEVIAHESAHSLLFGHTIDEPLVLNDEDIGYRSPLRKDLRPMDGIYHATFVSARMHWAMHHLATNESLDEARREQAAAAAKLDAENFYSGLSVIDEHAEMTAIGSELISQAKAYMDQACAHAATA